MLLVLEQTMPGSSKTQRLEAEELLGALSFVALRDFLAHPLGEGGFAADQPRAAVSATERQKPSPR